LIRMRWWCQPHGPIHTAVIVKGKNTFTGQVFIAVGNVPRGKGTGITGNVNVKGPDRAVERRQHFVVGSFGDP
jgi:hypothetical protein